MTTTDLIRLYEGDRVEITNIRGAAEAHWSGTIRIVRGDAYAKAHAKPKAAKKLSAGAEATARWFTESELEHFVDGIIDRVKRTDAAKKPAKKKGAKR